MDFSKYNIGVGITGSFCMFARTRTQIQRLVDLGANVIPDYRHTFWQCKRLCRGDLRDDRK